MKYILAPFRIFFVTMFLVIYMLHMCLVFLVIRDRWRRLWLSNHILTHYTRLGLFLFSVRVNVIGGENLKDLKGCLFVGNHLGYLDVLALSSKVSGCFVTSVEIKQTPGLGQVCVLAGCVFVERRNKNNIHNELSELRQGLEYGLHVTIFPEATSTGGEEILRFRRPLFLSAIEAGVPVVPFCLNYRKVGGKPVTIKNRNAVFWFGDMGFVDSIFRLGSCGGAELDMHFLPRIDTHRGMDPRDLSEQSQVAVESVFIPVKKEEGPGQGLLGG